MERGSDKPPPVSLKQLLSPSKDDAAVDDDRQDIKADAGHQIVTLIMCLCDKWLKDVDGIDEFMVATIPDYAGKERELYDAMIVNIGEYNHKNRMEANGAYPRVANIFNEMAGLTPEQRKLAIPTGMREPITVFNPVGEIGIDGV